MSKALRPKTAVTVSVRFYEHPVHQRKDITMSKEDSIVISELMEKALQCVEEFTEMQIVICKGSETITISNVDKVIRNLPKG